MKFIHHECLKSWFRGKRLKKRNQNVLTFFWENLECELCKTPYPCETKSADGKELFNVIEYDIPASKLGEQDYFIVFESLSTSSSKVIHVVILKSLSRLYFGRNPDADIKVTDLSVSRVHAFVFRTSDGDFYISDNHSKFGTEILV